MNGGSASSSEDDFDLSLSESISENNASDEDYCPSNFSDESEDIPDENSKNSPPVKHKAGKIGKSKKRTSVDSGSHSMSKEYDSMGSSASDSFNASSSDDDDIDVRKKKKKPSKKPNKTKSKTGKSISSR